MSRQTNFIIIISGVLVGCLFLSSCGRNVPLNTTPTPAFSQTPFQTITKAPLATIAVTTAPAPNYPFIITPDTLFSIPEIKVLNTPDSKYYCEHISPPQGVERNDRLSVLVGRFSLCPSISWPLVNTAMDLDNNDLVSPADSSGDIAMEYAHPGLDGEISYGVLGLNNAHIDEAETNALSFEYCKSILLLLNKNDPGVLNVHDKAIACVMTTEGQIALIRVENIYPLNTQGVEFSYAVLKNE